MYGGVSGSYGWNQLKYIEGEIEQVSSNQLNLKPNNDEQRNVLRLRNEVADSRDRETEAVGSRGHILRDRHPHSDDACLERGERKGLLIGDNRHEYKSRE